MLVKNSDLPLYIPLLKKQLKQIQVEGLQPILRSFLRSRSY